MAELDVVTGAFGYTGRYIARRLLKSGRKVRTLISHPQRPNPFGRHIEVCSFNFDKPAELTKSLEGASTLYNTYWVRFPRGRLAFESAVANTGTLIRAAEQAGVQRIVHISVTNPSEDSPLPYFKGKAAIEKLIVQSRLSYAIIRPTLIFGEGDILLNNTAWLLRRFPLFVIPGDGSYKLRPIFADDLAEMAIQASSERANGVKDAQGTEVLTFEEMVRLIARALGRSPRLIHLSPGLAYSLIRMMGYIVWDVILTREEIAGLMANLLISGSPPTGHTLFSAWIEENAGSLGVVYNSELSRHFR